MYSMQNLHDDPVVWWIDFLPVMPTKVNMEAATAAKMVAGLE